MPHRGFPCYLPSLSPFCVAVMMQTKTIFTVFSLKVFLFLWQWKFICIVQQQQLNGYIYCRVRMYYFSQEKCFLNQILMLLKVNDPNGARCLQMNCICQTCCLSFLSFVCCCLVNLAILGSYLNIVARRSVFRKTKNAGSSGTVCVAPRGRKDASSCLTAACSARRYLLLSLPLPVSWIRWKEK